MLQLLLVLYSLLVRAVGAFISLNRKTARSSKLKIIGFKSGIGFIKGSEVVESYGVKIRKHLPLINACLCEVAVDTAAIKTLSEDPVIEFIEDDCEGDIQVMPSLSLDIKKKNQEMPWGVKKIRAPVVWNKTRGEGVKVGIIDTGIDIHHPDLKENIENAVWVLKCQNLVDDNGHGTHVAGTIAALDNKIGVVGASPKVKIFSVKAFSKSGRGRISDVIEALNLCVENKVQIINMSFGFKSNKALEKAVKEVYKRNIVMVAAAGNSGGINDVMYPARYPEVIAVAASNAKDQVAWFSSGGPEVDVVAPGANILSTYKNGGYRKMSGTSMACPHVAAVCALLLSKHKLAPKDVKRIIKSTCKDLGYSKRKQGSGLVNAAATLKAK